VINSILKSNCVHVLYFFTPFHVYGKIKNSNEIEKSSPAPLKYTTLLFARTKGVERKDANDDTKISYKTPKLPLREIS